MSHFFDKRLLEQNSTAYNNSSLQNHTLMANSMVSEAFSESLKKYLFLYKETERMINADKNVTLYSISIEICGIPEYKDEDCRSLMVKVASALDMNLPYTDIQNAQRVSKKYAKTGVRSIVSTLSPKATDEFLSRAKLKLVTLNDIGYGFDFLQRNVVLLVNKLLSPITQGQTDFKIKAENKSSCSFRSNGKKIILTYDFEEIFF
ncbi:uncharacterized protein NPIL_235041 [Nephila pilipes]|uniref:Uncharacterized protein n=1 Tax=Nephila pilipes TaxID=299642 RepID=A0A8X6M7Q6_NEPPI|nr:uncharacterized protein NPIL_235041 [Nephila pilipes]